MNHCEETAEKENSTVTFGGKTRNKPRVSQFVASHKQEEVSNNTSRLRYVRFL